MTGGKPVASRGLRLRKTAAGLEIWASESGDWTLKMKSGKTIPVKAERPGAGKHRRRMERQLPGAKLREAGSPQSRFVDRKHGRGCEVLLRHRNLQQGGYGLRGAEGSRQTAASSIWATSRIWRGSA